MADARHGLGPSPSVFLKGRRQWQPADVGIAMAMSSFAAALVQIPAGVLVDGLAAKRLLATLSGLAAAAGCLPIAFSPHFATVIAADVMGGTGRFTLAQGLVALAVGAGAERSNLVSGYAVQIFGYAAGFRSLAAVASAALVVFATLMPETRPVDDGGQTA